ncbi:hypothetical protein K435DRAFT_654928, partial [Dendrothele bispora CBS 962.96]
TQKLSTRQKICAVMTEHLRESGNEQTLRFWTNMLLALDLLTTDGMSDEETFEEGGEVVKVVKDPQFRHPDFRALLAYVDATPRKMKMLFNQSGRKPLRRVVSDLITERIPPAKLPSTFYRPEYLALMMKGLVPWVPLDEGTALSVSGLISELIDIEDGRAFLER